MLDSLIDTPPATPHGPGMPWPPHRSSLGPSAAPRDASPAPVAPLRLHPAIEQRLAAAHPRLVRLARLRGAPSEAADDVAQETLLEAWRSLDALRDPERLDVWLDAICRNVCRRWARTHAALAARQQPFTVVGTETDGAEDAEALIPDPQPFDPEEELARQELATLLDRALAHLHPAARKPLALHYIAGLPAGEIAERMGLSTSAVEVRLHRARRALREVLCGALRDEAEAFGITLPHGVAEPEDGLRETRIWCPLCGGRRLAAEIDGTTGYIRFSCLLCGQLAQAISTDLLDGVCSYRPILSRLLTWLTGRFTHGLDTGETPCTNCGRIAKAEPRLPDGMPAAIIEQVGDIPLMHLRCPVCGVVGGADIARLTVDRLETQRFWRGHPRIRVLPPRYVEAEGMPAVVMRVESRTDVARLDVVWARETLQVLGVHEASGNG